MPLDQWKQLGADGLIIGTVKKTPAGVAVQVRLIEVASGRTALAKEYSGTLKNPRLYAHTASDEIHQQQRNLRGVARTKLAFTSDRDGERMNGPVVDRGISNIYMADYDGANQTRITVTTVARHHAGWSPDGKSIAYTSYRAAFRTSSFVHLRGPVPLQAGGRLAEKQNYLPAWSPDGTQARVHVESRRQRGDLRREPRRQRTSAA